MRQSKMFNSFNKKICDVKVLHESDVGYFVCANVCMPLPSKKRS